MYEGRKPIKDVPVTHFFVEVLPPDAFFSIDFDHTPKAAIEVVRESDCNLSQEHRESPAEQKGLNRSHYSTDRGVFFYGHRETVDGPRRYPNLEAKTFIGFGGVGEWIYLIPPDSVVKVFREKIVLDNGAEYVFRYFVVVQDRALETRA